MTVKELREELEQYPDDLEVWMGVQNILDRRGWEIHYVMLTDAKPNRVVLA